jgi:hypothetical protein
MTSAVSGRWAGNGPKVSPGRPSGLGPTSQWTRPIWPSGRSPPTLLKLELLAHRRTMGLTGLRWAGAPVRAHQTKLSTWSAYPRSSPASQTHVAHPRSHSPDGDDVADLEEHKSSGEKVSSSLRMLTRAPGLGEP